MGFFSILKTERGRAFGVEKLDVSYALLPGLFGRYAIFCDVGLRITPGPARADENLPQGQNGLPDQIELDLCLPFVAEEEDGVTDLVPGIRDKKETANLVFGNDNDVTRDSRNRPVYNDGERTVILTTVDYEGARRRSVDRTLGFSLWRISTAAPVETTDLIYLRVRFRVRQPGRTWSWQNGPRRRSHAISDIRINELRELPRIDSPPDFKSAMLDIESVNVFLCTPSNLRVGRVSPVPTYIRILEGQGWESYLQRRIGTQASVLLITHWKILHGATQRDPGRVLLELEKRTPTPIRAALTAVALSLAGFVVLSPPGTVAQSLLALVVSNVFAWIAGLSIATFVTFYKFVVPFVLDRRYRQLRRLLAWLENKRYRLRK